MTAPNCISPDMSVEQLAIQHLGAWGADTRHASMLAAFANQLLRAGVAATPAPESVLRTAISAYKESVPDDLRFMGWSVAVHNDYRVNGVPHTFWLLTKNGRAIKGEGETDGEALNIVREQVRDCPVTRPMRGDGHG